MPKVGVLWHAANPEGEVPYFGSLLEGFAQLGYTEGRIELIHRFRRNRVAGGGPIDRDDGQTGHTVTVQLQVDHGCVLPP